MLSKVDNQVQVSLGIFGGYVPEKFGSSNSKIAILGGFPLFSEQRIVKTANTKSANNRGHL